MTLIPRGYSLITEGRVQAGDKYWSPSHLAWLPVIVNDGRPVKEFDAVIRKGE